MLPHRAIKMLSTISLGRNLKNYSMHYTGIIDVSTYVFMARSQKYRLGMVTMKSFLQIASMVL